MMTSLLTLSLLASAGSLDLTLPGPVSPRGDLSVLLWVPWYEGVGVGVQLRYEYPIVPEGLLPGHHDLLSLEGSLGLASSSLSVPGAGYGYGGYYYASPYYPYYGYSPYGAYAYRPAYTYGVTDIAPALYGLWSLKLGSRARAYLGLGLGYNVGSYQANAAYGPVSASYVYWDVCAGLTYRLSRAFAARVDAGTQGFKAGVAYAF